MTLARRSIARNTLLNLGGLGIPLIVGLAVMPVLTTSLGVARFGMLGLTLALLEYSSLFQFGLGLATTKHVAERFARGEGEVSQIVTGSVLLQTLLGVTGGAVFALAAPLLVREVFVIPDALQTEALAVFRVLALMIPATLLLIALRAVLEAAHRFDLTNAIRMPSSVASFVIPAIAAANGASLPSIMILLLATRFLTCAAMLLAMRAAIPGLKFQVPHDWTVMRSMLSFGGWLTISSIVSPLLIYLDRFLLGALVGLAAVGHYTAPFDAVTRLLIFPGAAVNALFPSVTGLHAAGDRAAVMRVFGKAVRNISLILLIPVVVLVIWGPDILRIWLGDSFAREGGAALRILAVGIFVNALAHVPSSYLTALGRPDVSARFHVMELALHVPLAVWAITKYGVTGAAIAWTLRVTLDALLLFAAVARVLRTSLQDLVAPGGEPRIQTS